MSSLNFLSSGEKITFNKNDVVYDSDNKNIYFIAEGSVLIDIILDKDKTYKMTIGKNNFLSIPELFSTSKYKVKATSNETTVLYSWDKSGFELGVSMYPEMALISINNLCSLLRNININDANVSVSKEDDYQLNLKYAKVNDVSLQKLLYNVAFNQEKTTIEEAYKILGVEFHDKEVIFQQGDNSKEIYILFEGKIDIYLDNSNANTNVNANANANANVNANADNNANANANANTNVNVNANTNANANAYANANANANANVNADNNANTNANTNTNANANSNSNSNSNSNADNNIHANPDNNVNANANANANANVNENANANVNSNADNNIHANPDNNVQDNIKTNSNPDTNTNINELSYLSTIKAETFLGEMSHFDFEPRSATAIANGYVRMLKFTKDNFNIIFQLSPKWTINLIETLSNRITNTYNKKM